MARAGLVVAAASAVVVAFSGCTSPTTARDPYQPASVALAASGAPELTVGVVVSLTSPLGEGSDWAKAAEGAQVAAYRFRLGGAKVTVKAVDDKGSAKGAAAAVDELVQSQAAGIVLATEGTHVQAAVDQAAKSGVPVLLPYESDVSKLTSTAWATGPSAESVNAALAKAVAGAGAPLVLNGGGGTPETLAEAESEAISAKDEASRIVSLIKGHKKNAGTDVIVVTGPAAIQAKVERAVQGASITLPVVLGPQATSPAFATALAADGGSLSGDFVTVGARSGDLTALQADEDGQAMSAFLAGVRATAADSAVQDFFDGEAFSKVAAVADSRSHDAVVALVVAAAKAGSANPPDVAGALSAMTVTHDHGLAGPALTFESPSALAAAAVVPLCASGKDTGLRPLSETATQLHWFEAPAA